MLLGGTFLVFVVGCDATGRERRRADTTQLRQEIDSLAASDSNLAPVELSAPIARFCGDCHALPNPNSFERDVWYEEIRKGYEFYAKSGRNDLDPPALEEVLRYYRARAPARLEFPEVAPIDMAWKARFQLKKLDWKDNVYVTPAVASIRWLEIMAPDKFHLVVCDMRDGSISLVNPDPARTTRRVIGRVRNPARVATGDLDQDGHLDLVVADLGSFNPFDHQLGQVVWLRRQPGTPDFEPIVLADGLGRVSDVSVGDFTGNRQLDIAFAEFGHRRNGGISLLTQDWKLKNSQASMKEAHRGPSVERKVLDHRPGTVQLAATDWDRDGRLDFATVVSQESEAIDLFLNRPTAGGVVRFNTRPIWTANDLAFGSVGLEPVDLDLDGDLDLLYVNGDCFDNNYANRTHGLQWFENVGELHFEYHRLADLPGAYRALAGDMDGDGDQDIVAVANLPATVKPLDLRKRPQVSVLLLEQTGKMEFVERVLEIGTPRYPALEVADFDNNGKVDFAVGAQLFQNDPPESPAARLPRLTIWWAQ